MASSGNTGCNCIDASDTLSSLSSLSDGPCTTPDGEIGARARAGLCVPYSYGSDNCLLHDMQHDPNCQVELNSTIVPPYCFRPWCYVDRDACKRESLEAVYASDMFPNLVYSYSTCNSTAEDWLNSERLQKYKSGALGGISLYATMPAFYQVPNLYKRNASGEILQEKGDEYYDDSVPFEGLYVDYMEDLIRISNGDIKNITYTHTSKASSHQHPSSSFTAAVQDIENGIVDISVSSFWITAERLKMTAFTMPLYYEDTLLVIPMPGANKSFEYESSKVFGPFSVGLWIVALAIIAVSAILSVWFSDADRLAKKKYGSNLSELKRPEYQRKSVYARLALDAFLEKGLFFCSAGVEQEKDTNLPHKMLMFGFGFFILIAVSVYVANLAAFLTRSGTESFAGTMEEVVGLNLPICAHLDLKDELITKWPSANFVWSDNEWISFVEKYDAGKCKVLAVSQYGTILDPGLMQKFCNRGLVFTQSIVIETPIAFPIKYELASGVSYWIFQGERYEGVSMQKSLEDSVNTPCPVKLSDLYYQESDAFTRISPKNMILPITFFLLFATIAIILQILHQCHRGKGALTGRTSELELFRDEPKKTLKESVSDAIKVFEIPVKGLNSARDPVKLLDSSVPTCRQPIPSLAVGYNEERKTVEEEECDLDEKKSVLFNDVPRDDFSGNDDLAPGMKGLIGDYFDSSTAIKEGTPVSSKDKDDANHRILALLESGVIDDVLECFQEMKRLKKTLKVV